MAARSASGRMASSSSSAMVRTPSRPMPRIMAARSIDEWAWLEA
jgi:hypothetical protein